MLLKTLETECQIMCVDLFCKSLIIYKITNCGRWKNISGICTKIRFNSKGLSEC